MFSRTQRPARSPPPPPVLIQCHSFASSLVYNPGYLGIDRTDGIVFVHVFLATGRTEEVKRALYAKIAADISARTATRLQDVFITLSENTRADWSFGNGVAQYLDLPREQWR